ncbi:MAG: electron transport complex protein RnfC [Deltaproteobacteria bacterium]|nr:electron transport complex protein RnfC [Deltaproteobacteria bacterium]
MGNGISDAIKQAGVVGAGGAGFPTHVKAESRVDTVVANGSECEPLLHSDQALMLEYPKEIVAGLEQMMQATGASRGILALKARYVEQVEAFRMLLSSHPDVTLAELGNFYPSGDEQSLVYETTGRIVPEGGIPLNVGVVVDNVETLYNVHQAMKGIPVTERTVTVVGEVRSPGVYRYPVGTTVADAIRMCGGTTVPDVAVIDGGPMMGRIGFGLAGVIRKTTSGLIVVPADHPFVIRRTLPVNMELLRTVSMCCQCRECTDLCPRYQLGHDLEPHKVMRAVITRSENPPHQVTQAHICCQCGICETIACPLGLSPRNVFAMVRRELAAKGVRNPHHRKPEQVRVAYAYTKLPKERALARTGLSQYDGHSPYRGPVSGVRRVELLLSQHIGAPAKPVVRQGAFVNRGEMVAAPPDGVLSAAIHASISGRVTAVASDRIVIEG